MLWKKQEEPYFGTYTFAPTSEDGLVLRVIHGDGGLGEENGAIGITESTNVDKGVREGWEDVAIGGIRGELWECDSTCSGGLLDFTCGGTNIDRWSEWVDVSTQGNFIQVHTYRSTIKNVSVNKRKWGCYGRLWVGSRHRGGATLFGR